MWTAGFTPPLPLQNVRPGWISDFLERDKRKTRGTNYLPHFAAITIFLLALLSCVASFLPFL
jgi:hypothetical protein